MKTRVAAAWIAVLIVTLPAIAGDPMPKDGWKLPKEDAEKWAKRIGKLLPPEGWAVKVQDNDIIVQRDKPVRFEQVEINAPERRKDHEPTLRKGEFHLTFRFAPAMSMDEYERLNAVNETSEVERGRLQDALKLPHKFDDYIATTPEEKKRLQDYRAAVAKLPWHNLPQLYSTDYSISLFRSAGYFEFLYVKDEAGAECKQVEERLLRQFGTYKP